MILDSVSDLLPGLLPASYRGVAFFVPDASTEAGRRVAEHLFPGIDRAAYDDFGLRPAVITLDGLMVGDDYVAQAKALASAFERPGPATLMHPCLGGMTVLLEEPGEISFSSAELRVARFSATFKRVNAGSGTASILSTAAALLGAALDFRAAAFALGNAPETATLSNVRSLASVRSWRVVRSAWPGASPEATAPEGPAAFVASVAKVTDSLVASVPAVAGVPAVSAAAEAAEALPGVDALQAVNLCLAASAAITAAEAPSYTDRAMLLAAAGDAIATAARLSAYVDHASRDAAFSLRNRVAIRIDAYAAACGDVSRSAFAASASTAARLALDLRSRLVADLNEVIGRLPSVIVIETDRGTDAFQLANHVHGDRPGSIEAGYAAIVARNRPRHPALLPAGRVEVQK